LHVLLAFTFYFDDEVIYITFVLFPFSFAFLLKFCNHSVFFLLSKIKHFSKRDNNHHYERNHTCLCYISGEFTIFAPNNDAFSALPAATLTALGNDVTALADVLKYHVVQGKVPSSAASNELQLTTLNGDKVRFNIYDHNNVSHFFML
jgi:hypothetical protein